MTTRENPLLTMIREVCALGRVEFERPHTAEGDPDAGRALVRGLRALDPAGEPSDISLSLDLLAPRAPYFDQLVLAAIAAGVPQVVNLGAGYDDRALRFRHSGATFFDLDRPAVIADKVGRLEATGTDTSHAIPVGLDFRTDEVGEALARAGHDAARPTLFIAEHLALFLEPGDVLALMAGLSGRAAEGSTLALTAEVHPAGLDSDRVVAVVDQEMFGGCGPLHTVLDRDGWLALFAKTGWTVQGPDEVTAVDHFALPVAGQPVQIQTQFLTATV
ncbi:class I SAM-dependent methyltransferase [Amycolatopsis saalfeldensis]|uniref:S-adenosyl-L-methionine-dependent methyltransferase n=1 Tax=Amycolatopsis saalfeldensis TaxID=394193 RepID=A0A1H8ST39_9PSEU|nr:SAM-dependent methyltransferase [Amycolatopsis saalfeldensis]SEO81757.1 methyltransferase, TIGR00027 family [Amycolatopsis saalfeldensis]